MDRTIDTYDIDELNEWEGEEDERYGILDADEYDHYREDLYEIDYMDS